jgi:hypothetical protein
MRGIPGFRGLAEERLTDLKAMLEDMRRDRDAWARTGADTPATGTCGPDVMVAVAAYDRMRSRSCSRRPRCIDHRHR